MRPLLGEGWRLIRPHALPLSLLGLAVFVPLEVLLAWIDESRGADSWESWVLLLPILWATMLFIGLGVVMVQAGPRAASAVRELSPLTLLALGIALCLGTVVGFALLIVPGILLLAWWALAVQACVLERRGVFDSLARSRDLVRGRFWLALAVALAGVAAFLLPLALQLTSDSFVLDGIASALSDVASSMVYVALTTGLYRSSVGG